MMEENKDQELNLEDQFIEDVDDSFEEINGFIEDETYDDIGAEEAFVDTSEGKILDKDDVLPFDIIKAIATENGYEINDPAKGCKTCYGRGYQGIESKTRMPIPCPCIYPKKTQAEKDNEDFGDSQQNPFLKRKPNREIRRRMALAFRNQVRRIKKIKKRNGKREEENEYTSTYINKVVKKYIQLSSIKKTASHFDMSLTKMKKLLKDNEEKIEKTKAKLETKKGS